MHQKTKQFQAAKSTLQLIANNTDEILTQMDVAASTNIENLQLYFENLLDIYKDIDELGFDANIDTVLSLRAELTDFLGCFLDNILYFNGVAKIKKLADPLVLTFEEYYNELEGAGEFDVRENLTVIKKYRDQFVELSEVILGARTKTSIVAITVYRSLINVFENFLTNLAESIEKDANIYDVIQYMTILDAMKYYYVDSVAAKTFYSMMLQTKITGDVASIKACLDDTQKLDGYDFDKTLSDIKTYKVYLLSLKDECAL